VSAQEISEKNCQFWDELCGSGLAKELFGYRGVVNSQNSIQRATYDTNSAGDVAPHTDWISIRSLRHLSKQFTSFYAKRENISNEYFFKSYDRDCLLLTSYPQYCGLDIYAHAVK
jgi:hypothetical protein